MHVSCGVLLLRSRLAHFLKRSLHIQFIAVQRTDEAPSALCELFWVLGTVAERVFTLSPRRGADIAACRDRWPICAYDSRLGKDEELRSEKHRWGAESLAA